MAGHELDPRPPSPEQAKPLTIILSENAQKGLLASLRTELCKATYKEVLALGRYPQPLKHMQGVPVYGYSDVQIEKFDEVRKIAIAIAKHLGESIDPNEALMMGLTDFIPPDQLRTWADMTEPGGVQSGRWMGIPKNLIARYLLEKEARKQKLQQP